MRRAGSNRDQIVPSPSIEADEKADKLRQRDQNRFLQVVLFLGILSLIFLVGIVKLHHTPGKRAMRHGYKATMVKQTTIESDEAITNSSAKP
jgi:hypothetical protein